VKFSSKILAVAVNYYFDPDGDVVFAAEAGGNVAGLRLSTNELSVTPRGPQAPLTSIAFYGSKVAAQPFTTAQIFAGCWDKSIWQYTYRLGEEQTAASRTVISHSSFPAHTDFVKCLLVAQTPDKQAIIISGGADGDIRFWTLGGQKLGSLKAGCRGVECLVSDPLAPGDAPRVMFSTSQREIFEFTLPDAAKLAANGVKISNPIVVHETSVYKLYFDGDGDLWTASADKTAKHLVRDRGWTPDTTLQHPDFVRDVVCHDLYGWVITACRDEEIRVWNRASGELYHVFTGHFEEVTGLCLIGDLLVSVSIDATLRRWSLAPADLRKAVDEARNPKLLEQASAPVTDPTMLTEEEEAELRALMEAEEQVRPVDPYVAVD